jgi:phosphoribosylcarboxyaminoimidazole (NCAIR) mutase
MHSLPLTSNEADEIARAEQLVAERKAELSRSLRRAGETGEAMARRLGDELKPTVKLVVAVAGITAVALVGVAMAKRARRRSGWFAPAQPSPLALAAKNAGLWAVRILARRAVQELASRLAEPRASVATAPNQVER